MGTAAMATAVMGTAAIDAAAMGAAASDGLRSGDCSAAVRSPYCRAADRQDPLRRAGQANRVPTVRQRPV